MKYHAYKIHLIKGGIFFPEVRYYMVKKSLNDFDLKYIPGVRTAAVYIGHVYAPFGEWNEVPDLSAWKTIKGNESFDWSLSLEEIDRKYKNDNGVKMSPSRKRRIAKIRRGLGWPAKKSYDDVLERYHAESEQNFHEV